MRITSLLYLEALPLAVTLTLGIPTLLVLVRWFSEMLRTRVTNDAAALLLIFEPPGEEPDELYVTPSGVYLTPSGRLTRAVVPCGVESRRRSPA